MHALRPSIWVELLRPTRSARAARTRQHAFVAALVASSLPLVGCGGGNGPTEDAATRSDASIVETGLAFDDAFAAASDASSPSDAYPVRDGGLSLCRGSCDPIHAMGCGTGELCVLRAEESMCGAPSRGLRGTPCTSVDSCAAGHACFLSDTGEGVCERICCPLGDDCAAGEVCSGDGTLVDGTATSWGRCTAPRACSLLDPTACPDREACYVVGSLGASECLLAGVALEGDVCTLPNDCAPGLVCAGALDRACVRLCELGLADDPCGTGTMCVRQAYTPEGVGVCVAAAARVP